MTSVALPNNDRGSPKTAGKPLNVPPITIPSSAAPNTNITRSPFKFLKKHEKKQIANVTAHPVIKETTVIDDNSTSPTSNITDSEMINSSINAMNLTYLGAENHTSQICCLALNRTEMSSNLSAAGITGITMGCVSLVGVICAVSFVVYRNRGLNRPQVLNDRCSNPDSSGYIDDASIRVRIIANLIFAVSFSTDSLSVSLLNSISVSVAMACLIDCATVVN